MTDQDTTFLSELAAMVLPRLEKMGAKNIQTDLGEQIIRFEYGNGNQEMFLGTLKAYCLKESPEDREAVVDRYLSSLKEHSVLIDAKREDVLSKLMPIVRSDGHQYIAFRSAQDHGGSGSEEFARLPSKPLGGGLRIYLAIDTPNAMAMVSDKHLSDWGTSFDAALSAAMHELREKSTHGIWVECGPGLFKSKWNDGYDSSRLLLPDALAALPVRNPVFMVPAAHTLLVTSGDNPQALALMAKLALDEIATIQRVLTLNLLAFKDDKLTTVAPPEPVERVLKAHRSRHNAWRYEMQQDALVAELKRKEDDVFVASLKLFTSPEGDAFGIAVWGADVTTLLPVADLVALVAPDKQSPGGMRMHGFVEWQELHRKLGHLLQKTSDEPPRFRTLRFPEPDELAKVTFRGMGST